MRFFEIFGKFIPKNETRKKLIRFLSMTNNSKDTKQDRKETLKALFAGFDGYTDVIEPLIDDVVFLEERLKELRAMPMIRVHPSNPAKQKATPAAKMYKEFLQQYNNCVKILEGVLKVDDEEEASPLREWVKVNANA